MQAITSLLQGPLSAPKRNSVENSLSFRYRPITALSLVSRLVHQIATPWQEAYTQMCGTRRYSFARLLA